jgi:hypothetical protein
MENDPSELAFPVSLSGEWLEVTSCSIEMRVIQCVSLSFEHGTD